MAAQDADASPLAAICSFIVDELGASPDDLVAPEVRLVEDEIVDSLGIFSLVDFIEDHFGVSVDPEEITIDNFGTLAAIEGLVAGKLAPR
jgi:acyl carrier protein